MIIKRLSKVEYDYLHSLKDENKTLSQDNAVLNQRIEMLRKEVRDMEYLIGTKATS